MKIVFNEDKNTEFPFDKCFLDELQIKENFGYINIKDTIEKLILKKSSKKETRIEHSNTC